MNQDLAIIIWKNLKYYRALQPSLNFIFLMYFFHLYLLRYHACT